MNRKRDFGIKLGFLRGCFFFRKEIGKKIYLLIKEVVFFMKYLNFDFKLYF